MAPAFGRAPHAAGFRGHGVLLPSSLKSSCGHAEKNVSSGMKKACLLAGSCQDSEGIFLCCLAQLVFRPHARMCSYVFESHSAIGHSSNVSLYAVVNALA